MAAPVVAGAQPRLPLHHVRASVGQAGAGQAASMTVTTSAGSRPPFTISSSTAAQSYLTAPVATTYNASSTLGGSKLLHASQAVPSPRYSRSSTVQSTVTTGATTRIAAHSTATLSFQAGDTVEARWGQTESWFAATVSSRNADGTYTIDWTDGNTHGRKKVPADIRRPGAKSNAVSAAASPTTARPAATAAPQTSSTVLSPAALRSPATAASPFVAAAGGTSASTLQSSTTVHTQSAASACPMASAAQPTAPAMASANSQPAASQAGAIAQPASPAVASATSQPSAATVHSAAAASQAAQQPTSPGAEMAAANAAMFAPFSRAAAGVEPVSSAYSAVAPGTAGAAPSSPVASGPSPTPSPAGLWQGVSLTSPHARPLQASEPGTERDVVHEIGAEVEVDAERPKPRDDVKCFMVELANGEKGVVVERGSDGKRWRFNRKSIEFELAADAAALDTWLEGIKDQQMPGLLTLLADEVNERGSQLKAVEKDRDAMRGDEDYDFFGLDGAECSDKDIERAYRKKSMQLHPDKGGDEKAFDDMRKKYEQIVKLRGEEKRKEGGGSIKWDPNCRLSMMKAHSDLREQLIWITRHIEEAEEELVEMKRRQLARHTLTWAEGQ